jgi:hypothetical protein
VSIGVLPEDGEDLAFTVIGLPGPGRRQNSQGKPVTWITAWVMTGAGTTWARLIEKSAETGLRPSSRRSARAFLASPLPSPANSTRK